MNGEEDDRAIIWKLPVAKSKELGKVGPAFGLGVGCGLGFGVGLVGGVGIGAGFPGLYTGFGLGAGCGIGLGFGYGMGKGVARDEYQRYSNVGKLFRGLGSFPSEDPVADVINELVVNTKKLVRATSREIEKWRR